jgi:hypothetical protein
VTLFQGIVIRMFLHFRLNRSESVLTPRLHVEAEEIRLRIKPRAQKRGISNLSLIADVRHDSCTRTQLNSRKKAA